MYTFLNEKPERRDLFYMKSYAKKLYLNNEKTHVGVWAHYDIL